MHEPKQLLRRGQCQRNSNGSLSAGEDVVEHGQSRGGLAEGKLCRSLCIEESALSQRTDVFIGSAPSRS